MTGMTRLQRSDVALVVIDLQERLMPVIHDAAAVTRNVDILIRGARVLDVPLLVTEQYVKGLGPTIEPLRRALAETSGYTPIEKATFSAWGVGEFVTSLRQLRRKQVLVAGVETHVCVYQTVSDLLANGYDVTVAGDAVSSRTLLNRDLGLRRMAADGARLSSTEMALFELLGTSGTDEFREIARLVK
jgi:nicotinamidase-related amidase